MLITENLGKAKKQLKKTEDRLAKAKAELKQTIERTSTEITREIAKQNIEYGRSLAKSRKDEPGAMEQISELAGAMANRGELARGDEVEMQHGSARWLLLGLNANSPIKVVCEFACSHASTAAGSSLPTAAQLRASNCTAL